MRTAYRSALFVVLGLAIVAAVIVAVGPGRTLHALRDVHLPRLLLGAAILPAIWTLRILRWCVLLRAAGGRASLGGLLTSYCLGAAAGMLTPARLGELSASGMVGRAAGRGSAEGASAIAVDSAVTLMFLSVGGGVGAAYLQVHGLSQAWVEDVVLGAVLVLALLAIALMAGVQGWAGLTTLCAAVARLSSGTKGLAWLNRAAATAATQWLPRLHESAAQIRSARMAWVVLLCLAAMTLAAQAAAYYFMVTSVLNAPWPLVVACFLLAFAAAQGSGLPGGGGVGAATFVAAASSAGCDPAQAAAGAVAAGAVAAIFAWGAAGVSLAVRMTQAARVPPQLAGQCRSEATGK